MSCNLVLYCYLITYAILNYTLDIYFMFLCTKYFVLLCNFLIVIKYPTTVLPLYALWLDDNYKSKKILCVGIFCMLLLGCSYIKVISGLHIM